jgi:hypothetical protein
VDAWGEEHHDSWVVLLYGTVVDGRTERKKWERATCKSLFRLDRGLGALEWGDFGRVHSARRSDAW